MKIIRSFLFEPGEVRYGARRIKGNISSRLRMVFFLVFIRTAVLAGFCFLLPPAAFDTNSFATFKAIAPLSIWGTVLTVSCVLSIVAAVESNGTLARIALLISGVTMIMAGSSFGAAAIQFGTGWWGAVGYICMGLGDILIASYRGEVS